MKTKQKKSKWRYWWIVLLVLLVAIGSATIWFVQAHPELMQIFGYAGEYTEDELEQKHRDLSSHTHEVVAEVSDMNMSILNDRDRRKLSGGDLTPEQTAEIFREARKRAGLPEVTPQPTAERELSPSASPGASPTESPKPVQCRDVDTLIEEFYILKAKYLTNLDGLVRQCKTEWRSKPKAERTFSARLAMAEKCMRLRNALEVECDAEMAALVSELRLSLTKSGKSTAIITEIQNIYNEEKSIKKAALMDRYYPK